MESTTSYAPPLQRSEEPDPRNSLRHVLATDPSPEMQPTEQATPVKPAGVPAIATPIEEEDNPYEIPHEEKPSKAASASSKGAAEMPMYTSTTTTTRRNANGSVSSVYSGNKIRHLKKEDGIPLWREDIQYDFLRYVFEDDKKVFTKAIEDEKSSGHTFADIYLDAMARSSKCSKILKDKLLTERAAAINMAMVCLLVNVGRMNTTLNFFPEMRAQLRTYHSIPSLQAHQDPNAYKQLQDAPRLKSILKGATEDTEQPSTIEEIKSKSIPRTNPVNLIFVLAQYAPKISEIHFFPPRDFFDLVMRSALSSKSRATAFLWLMWWYLESDFSEHDALNNPFGPGQRGHEGDATGGLPIKCPPFQHLTKEEVALENVDTEEEKVFGEIKRKERIAILASDMAPVVTGPKRTAKKGFNNNPVFSVLADEGASTPSRDNQSPHGSVRGGRAKAHAKAIAPDYLSDTDRTRSVSPPGIHSTNFPSKSTPNMRINTLLNDETPSVSATPVSKGPGRGNWSRNRTNATSSGVRHALKNEAGSPSTNASALGGPHGFYLPLNGTDPVHKRTRPLTAHQVAVERYRKERVDFILDRRLREEHKVSKRRRLRQGALARAWLRLRAMPEDYHTDEEMLGAEGHEQLLKAPPPIFAGLLPTYDENDDFGEEAASRAQIMRRTRRRLERWEGGTAPIRRKKKDANGTDLVWVNTPAENERAQDQNQQAEYEAGDEELDDIDRDVLGEVDGDDTEEEVDEDQEMVGA